MTNAGSIYLFSLISSLCILFGINFLFRKGKLIAAKILAIQLLTVGFLVAASFYILPENILQFPYFFRTIAPFHYALPPLNFLFFWYLFHPKEKFNKAFLLLFFPFLIQFFEYLPFYLSSREVKLEEISWMMARGNFFAYSPRYMWIEPMIHNYAKFIYAIVLCVFMLVYYLKFRRLDQYQNLFKNRIIHLWVLGLLIFRIGLILYALSLYFLDQLGKFDVINYILIAEFFNIFYLTLFPNLLDVESFLEKLRSNDKTKTKLSDLEHQKLSGVVDKVEGYFKSTQVFLNSQLTVELLGTFTGMPHRSLSLAIKHVHGISFRDFLNNYRIAYLEQNLSNPKHLSQSTIETLAKEAGFGSRQGFYTAFKKAKGCTPKEYFNRKKTE
jgi:AraC-like DNA-binding protein